MTVAILVQAVLAQLNHVSKAASEWHFGISRPSGALCRTTALAFGFFRAPHFTLHYYCRCPTGCACVGRAMPLAIRIAARARETGVTFAYLVANHLRLPEARAGCPRSGWTVTPTRV